jgi:hypothetical protein
MGRENEKIIVKEGGKKKEGKIKLNSFFGVDVAFFT